MEKGGKIKLHLEQTRVMNPNIMPQWMAYIPTEKQYHNKHHCVLSKLAIILTSLSKLS